MTTRLLSAGYLCISMIFTTNALAQSSNFCSAKAPSFASDLNAIVPALYDIVSGDAGSEKNWSLMQSLFVEGAIITPVFHENQQPTTNPMSVDNFIELNKKVSKNINFYESEVKSRVFQYGHMATILSHYESRNKIGAKPYSEGVNSFQLLNDGNTWCVVSVTWDSDKGGHGKVAL